MNTKFSAVPQRGSFALVTYIPDPLGSFLQSLRLGLPGEENPQAHITILPPRPLQFPLEIASLEAQRILHGFEPFAIKLSEVSVFPETNILYLDVAEGNDALHKLHDALNTESLAHEENFEFLPHLTLSGPIPAGELAKVRAEAELAWANRPANICCEVDEVVALWQPLNGSWDDWNRVWSRKLGGAGNSARAGKS
jgi:2'-5' RNA ligase